MKITAYIIAHNEEKNLPECIDSVLFCDEIIVLLDKCSDGSKAICESRNIHIIEGAWDKEGDRRNACIDAATGEWILELDADERVTPALAQEIRALIDHTPFQLFGIPYDNYIGNRLVKYGWGAYIGVSQKSGLFRKGAKRYCNKRIGHAEPIIEGHYGPALQNAMIHWMDKDFSDTLRRFERYTKARSQELIELKINESFFVNFRRMFSRFYKCYVRRHGYREGATGFVIAMLAGLYPMISYIRAKERF